jgi:Beta-Casp domain
VRRWRGVSQSGLSRQLFEEWCEDPKNGVIIADFAVQGTLAREILGSPAQVMTKAGIKVRWCTAASQLLSTAVCVAHGEGQLAGPIQPVSSRAALPCCACRVRQMQWYAVLASLAACELVPAPRATGRCRCG